jgi:hypothetical protein
MKAPAPTPPTAANDDDDLGMQIERVADMLPTASSGRPRADGRITSGRAGSGLDLAYKRSDLEDADGEPSGPSMLATAGGYALVLVGFAGAFAALGKLVHRPNGHLVTKLLPRAFDATSASQSGGVALAMFVTVILLGYFGLRLRPRSYAILVAAGAMLLASLAMVTVTLVATDEHPTPPDGALVVPYLVPAALVLAGMGLAPVALRAFHQGGTARIGTVLLAAAAGAVVFLGVECSALARLLPF